MSKLTLEQALAQADLLVDRPAIDAAIAGILAANADKVEQYKAGKEALFGFFVGQTMRAMQGKGNPALVNELLKTKLS